MRWADVMTVGEVAQYLRVNPQTVYRRAEAGGLPAIRIGRALRFQRDLLEEWLRLMAVGWDARRQRTLYAWAEGFATQRRLRESDVAKVMRRRRYATRRAA